ncbi:hypothetical protein GPALN_016353 [Globodera pallida]|nr:hypothetical protein GPALN_016353 [Globodera pallida]
MQKSPNLRRKDLFSPAPHASSPRLSSSAPVSLLLALLVLLPSISSALYIVRLQYVPVDLLDEFSEGRGSVTREKRRAESAAYNDRLAPPEMDFLGRELNSRLRQLAAEEEEEEHVQDQEELAQRWNSLRRSIEDNVLEEAGDGQRSAREEQDDEEEQFVPSSTGMDDEGQEEDEQKPPLMVFDAGERPRGQQSTAGGGDVVLLEL